MAEVGRGDREFPDAFATAGVSKAHFARYYLRALERTLTADPQPEFVPNEDNGAITLEHVMPLSPGPDWEVDVETAAAAQRLLGNMVLLREARNRELGNGSFA